MTIEEKVAVILSKSDAEIKEAFEYSVDLYYAAASRMKVKMPMRPFLVAPRGAQGRSARRLPAD